MASAIFFSDESAEAQCDVVTAKCNGGSIRIYDGTKPTDANTAVTTQNLLATFAFASTAFGSSTPSGTTPTRSAVATANTIADVVASATGDATWFRALKSDGTSVVFDGTAGVSGTDLIMTDASLTSGETCSVGSLTLAAPE